MIVLNADGLIAKRDMIAVFLHEDAPSVVIVVESHLIDIDEDALIVIGGYNHVRSDSDSRYTGGIVIYVQEELSYEVIFEEVRQREWWVLAVKVYAEARLLGTFAGVYRSPSQAPGEFIDRFNGVMEELLEMSQKDCTIGGDFNIDWQKENDLYTRKLRSCIDGVGMKQIVKRATRVTNKGGTLIDLVITDNRNLECEVLDKPRMSDHSMLSVKGIINPKMGRGDKFLMKGKIDMERLVEIMKLKNESVNRDNRSDVQREYIDLRNDILQCLQEAKKPDRWVRNVPCPWFSKEIKSAMVKRDLEYSKFLLLQEIEGQEREVVKAWEQYKKCRNICVDRWRKAKMQYYEDMFVRLKDEPKELWKNLKKLYKVKDKAMKSVRFGDECVLDPKQIADRLNEYFVESVEDLVANIPKLDDNQMRQSEEVGGLCKFEEVTVQEVGVIVKGLKEVLGSDGISAAVYKKLWPVLGERITNIVNESLRQKMMPKILKTSTVVPIPKVKGSNKCSDQRPVNNLQLTEKVIESVVYTTLLGYIKDNDFMTESQSGFREQHSTETALQLVIDDWLRARDRDEGIVAVFLDYRRAFETINRNLLLQKLQKLYRIGGDVYQWLENYLEERHQRVKFNNVVSEERVVKWGVPQGSKLGPLLFILYVNDLPQVLKKCKIHMFADDTLIYYTGKDVQEVITVLNEELRIVSQWLQRYYLSLNVGKTECMVMGKQRFREEAELCEIKLGETALEWVQKYKYLGVIIDSKLSFGEHVEYINKKMAKKVNILYKSRKVLSRAGKEQLFRSMVVPHIKYCSTVLLMATKGDIKKLQVNFNKGIRAVLNKRRSENVARMLKELEFLYVREEIVRDVLTFIYRLENGLLPGYLEGLVRKNSDVHSYGTRQAGHFHVTQATSSRGQSSLFHRGLVIYNGLPQSVKQSSSVGQFRKEVVNWFAGDRMEW